MNIHSVLFLWRTLTGITLCTQTWCTASVLQQSVKGVTVRTQNLLARHALMHSCIPCQHLHLEFLLGNLEDTCPHSDSVPYSFQLPVLPYPLTSRSRSLLFWALQAMGWFPPPHICADWPVSSISALFCGVEMESWVLSAVSLLVLLSQLRLKPSLLFYFGSLLLICSQFSLLLLSRDGCNNVLPINKSVYHKIGHTTGNNN